MRVKSLLILLSVTALGAYTVGRHSSPVNNAPVASVAQPPVARPAAAHAREKPAPPEFKRKVEGALTAARDRRDHRSGEPRAVPCGRAALCLP